MPADHPLRAILSIVDAALVSLSAEFQTLYAVNGRLRLPPSGCCVPCIAIACFTFSDDRPGWTPLISAKSRRTSERDAILETHS